VLPITSSSLGAADLIIIAVMTTTAEVGTDTADAAAAGEFVWRIFYSILAVPVGVFTLNRFRKRNAGLMRDAWDALNEMREQHASSPARAHAGLGIG
jgi:hypothetical protein